MSDLYPAEFPSAPGSAGLPPTSAPPMPWSSVPPTPVRRPARWPVFALLVITLIAVGAAVAAWLRPMPDSTAHSAPPAPTFTDQQVTDAKTKVCAAYAKVLHAVNVNRTRSGGDDPTAQLAVAINARQIMVAGGAYLLTTLADEPATPPDLTAAVKKLSDLYQIITLNGLASEAGVLDEKAGDEAGSTIESLCK